MSTINIKQLIGNLIIVTAPENLHSDLEAKVSATLLKALQSVQGQAVESPKQNSDKCLQQLSNRESSS